MSRAPPFPTRRRSPSVTNGVPFSSQPLSAPGIPTTRPLQISRPRSRPTTPVTSYPSNSPSYPNTAPLGPSRPQISELRARADYSGSDRASTASQDPYRDSTSTSRSDIPYRTTPQSATSVGRQQTQRIKSPVQGDNDEATPTSLNSALSAFQSAGSRRRQTADSEEEYNYQRERELEIEEEKLRQQRIREKAPGIHTKGRRKGGEIDAVLDQVRDGWEFVIDPDFNNVDLALQLLDKSSLGKDIDSFRKTKNLLSKALKGSVDKHYQAFAAALPHHSSLLSHLSSTQVEIASARSALMEAKECLGGKRADLVQLWNRGQILEEMIKILDQIEHLKSVPDLLETLMSEKRLLQASILLVRSLKIINKPDMLEIGAVSDLRSYLNGQESALTEILIDELQSHLYLKSFWCESRWAAYVPNQQTFPKVEFEIESDIHLQQETYPSSSSPTPRSSRLSRFLNNLSLRPNDPPHDPNDTSFSSTSPSGLSTLGNATSSTLYISSNPHPEADSFTYMETLLESLAVLGKLGNALDNIAQRMPGELYTLVETTVDEVEERVDFGKRRSSASINVGLGTSEAPYTFNLGNSSTTPSSLGSKSAILKSSSSLRLSALESLATRGDHEILKDLFWTLYSKLDAVAQGFRVVTEIASRIGSRRDYKDASGTKPGTPFPLLEIWSHVQTEVRTLIRDYLIDEQQGTTSGRNPISSINEVLRDGKFNRDRGKPVFRFSDTDVKITTKALRVHEDGLTKVLKDTMPGLAPTTAVDTAQSIVASATDDRLLGTDQHHRLLIRPDAFHVTVLFQPTLTFFHHVSEVLPSGAESIQASTAVLDDFVLKVYLPQLEEKVSDLFHEAVAGSESFQIDRLSLQLSSEPLAKASTQLMALINSLCAMLKTSPFHRENYSRLILGVVIQFYQRCSDRFQLLTTNTSSDSKTSQVALAAQWAQRSELQPCFSELIKLEEQDSNTRRQLFRQETNIEMEFLSQKPISAEDLISSNRNLSALAILYRSVSWFSAELNHLKARPTDAHSVTTPNNLEPLTGFTPSSPFMPEPSPPASVTQLNLPLSREMALRFQALLKTYDQLSNLILDTIRLDIRCRTIHYLDAAIRHGTYNSSYEAAEPDPHIVDLNTELMRSNEAMSISLPCPQRNYLFSGLGHLMEHILISNAAHLRLPNDFGIKKIIRNILALQQSIKTLVSNGEDSGLERAKRYYSLFFITSQEMLDGIRQRQSFTFEEYQTMLNLQCKVDPSQSSGSNINVTDRNYSIYSTILLLALKKGGHLRRGNEPEDSQATFSC